MISPVTEYRRDITKLIGVDYENIPKDELRMMLHKSLDIIPYLLSMGKETGFEEMDAFLRAALGLPKKPPEGMNEFEVCNALSCRVIKANYWRRRLGKAACTYRTVLGSYMTKKIAVPNMTPFLEETMTAAFQKLFPLAILGNMKLKLLIGAMTKLTVDSGEFLIKEGDFIEKLFYIQSGLFGTVSKVGQLCFVIENFKVGDIIGADDFFFGNMCTKTIKCLQLSNVWLMDSKTYHSVRVWELEKTYTILDESVSKVPGLAGGEASRFVNAMKEIDLDSGVDVLAATPRSSVYVVMLGKVNAIEANLRGDEFTKMCGPGDLFGTDRLVCNKFAKLSSAWTVTKTKLFYMETDVFERLFDILNLYKISNIEINDNLFYYTL